MKRAILALLLAGALLAGCSRGTPKAVTPETGYDFGDVPVTADMRQAITKEFIIANEGTADLRLQPAKVKLLQGC